MTSKFLVVFLLLILTEVAFSQPLAIRQLQRDESIRFVEEAAGLESACGKAIPAEIDWSQFEADDYRQGYSVGGYCSTVVSAIRGICGDDLGREAVVEKIERLVCTIGEERGAELMADGTYRYTFTWDDANSYQWHQAFLGNNL